MAVIVTTNVDSLRVQNSLRSSTNTLSKTMERMSTGLKINSAKDDAAGCVIASKMQVQLDGNLICQNNVQNGDALLSTAEGSLDEVVSNLTRIRDLILQAKNGTYSDDEVEAMNNEVQQRIQEIDRVSDSSKYSQLKLFNDDILKEQGIKFQVGQNPGDENVITASADLFKTVHFSAITGMTTFTLSRASVAADPDPLTNLDNAINNIEQRKTQIGSVQSRLESALNTLSTGYTNLSASKSLITDADIAKEASEYTNASILQQISTSMLAQANQAPSIALSIV